MAHAPLLRTKFMAAFRWFGFGAVLLGVTLLGSVSADDPSVKAVWRPTLLSMGALGTIGVFIGLAVLFFALRRLRKEED